MSGISAPPCLGSWVSAVTHPLLGFWPLSPVVLSSVGPSYGAVLNSDRRPLTEDVERWGRKWEEEKIEEEYPVRRWPHSAGSHSLPQDRQDTMDRVVGLRKQALNMDPYQFLHWRKTPKQMPRTRTPGRDSDWDRCLLVRENPLETQIPHITSHDMETLSNIHSSAFNSGSKKKKKNASNGNL